MKNKRIVRKHRTFSVELKQSIVREFEQGKYTILELSNLHKVSQTSLYKWVYHYSANARKRTVMVEVENSSTQRLKDYEKRIAELERQLGKKQIKLDYYEELINTASDFYKVDLKKSSGIKP